MLIYLQGIPEAAEVAVPVPRFPASPATETGTATAPVSGAPNSSPLNMFPQVRNSDVGWTSIICIHCHVFLKFKLEFSRRHLVAVVVVEDLDLLNFLETIHRWGSCSIHFSIFFNLRSF